MCLLLTHTNKPEPYQITTSCYHPLYHVHTQCITPSYDQASRYPTLSHTHVHAHTPPPSSAAFLHPTAQCQEGDIPHVTFDFAGNSYFGALLCVAWSTDGSYIITGGEDDLVRSRESAFSLAWDYFPIFFACLLPLPVVAVAGLVT